MIFFCNLPYLTRNTPLILLINFNPFTLITSITPVSSLTILPNLTPQTPLPLLTHLTPPTHLILLTHLTPLPLRPGPNF